MVRASFKWYAKEVDGKEFPLRFNNNRDIENNFQDKSSALKWLCSMEDILEYYGISTEFVLRTGYFINVNK